MTCIPGLTPQTTADSPADHWSHTPFGTFSVHALSSLEEEHPLFQRQRLEHYELLWLQEGSGSMRIHKQTMHLQPHTIYCLAPGQVRHCALAPASTGYYLSFTLEMLYFSTTQQSTPTWFHACTANLSHHTLHVDPITTTDMESIVLNLHKASHQPYPQQPGILTGWLNILLLYCSRTQPATSQPPASPSEIQLVRTFMSMLQNSFPLRKMCKDYAIDLHVSTGFLNYTVRKLTGHSATHHIQQRIMLEAKRQAIYSHERMKEVALRLGFEDVTHFSKFFRNNTGENFRNYRKKWSPTTSQHTQPLVHRHPPQKPTPTSTTQRLKSIPTVIDKLKQHPNMQLTLH